VPDQVGLELIAAALGEAIPGSVLDTEYFRGEASLQVAPAAVRPVLAELRESHGYRESTTTRTSRASESITSCSTWCESTGSR
jgi:hypothetical protein